MTTDELSGAIDGFREAQDALAVLAQQAAELESATASLETAHVSVAALAEDLNQATGGVSSAAALLGELSEQLGLATDALRKADPSYVHREIARMSETTERLGSRMDEMAGDLKSRLEQHDDKVLADIGGVDSAIRDAIKRLERQEKKAAADLGQIMSALDVAVSRVDDSIGDMRADSERRYVTMLKLAVANLVGVAIVGAIVVARLAT